MLVLSASNLTKSYGVNTILEDVHFNISKGDRVGVVGPNGMGKTTLLNMLAGELTQSSGEIFVRSGYTICYFRQKANFLSQGTVIAEAERSIEKFRIMEAELATLEKTIADRSSDELSDDLRKALENYNALMDRYKDEGGLTYKSELQAILKSMGFGEETYDKQVGTLSGGESTRLALACLLLKKPEILMLDEPTNHLDLKMLEWLEGYLKSYKGTLIVVSHDRYFLDNIVTSILDVRDKTVACYRGNYSEYVIKREAKLEVMEREYQKQQQEIEKQEEIIRRFKGHNTEKLVKRAQSREKKLEHMERLDKPVNAIGKIKINFQQDYKSGNDVAKAENLEIAYGPKQIFKNVSFDIKSGERICMIGGNGVGKTTLLRILIGQLEPDDGYLKIGHNVNFGYYDQGQKLLDENETVLGEMNNAYRLIDDTEMRSILGRFLFKGDDVFKTIKDLSGGERARLSLLKLMLSGANTLVLDEPTNHLDIESREAVEDALADFPGTVIIVSHDRYLLDKFPDRIFELTSDGLIEYKGKFDYYLEKSGQSDGKAQNFATRRTSDNPHQDSREELSAEEQRRMRKEREANERRRARELAALEKRIPELEERVYSLEVDLCSDENLGDILLLRKLSDALEDTKLELEDAYAQWLKMQDEASGEEL